VKKKPPGKARAEADGFVKSLEIMSATMPGSKSGMVRFLLPEIEKALGKGHRMKDIWGMLSDSGLDVSLDDFYVYVGRARKKRKLPPGEKIEIAVAEGDMREPADEDVLPLLGGVRDGKYEGAKTVVASGEKDVAGSLLEKRAERALRDLRRSSVEWPLEPRSVKDYFGE
jgi:hypothetical protein